MNFERGKDPKESLRIGLKERLHEEIQKILEENAQAIRTDEVRELYQKELSEKFDVDIELVIKSADKKAEDWYPDVLIVKCPPFEDREYDIPWNFFANVKNVAAKLVTHDLVPVIPMSAPKGHLFYLDYKYKDKWYKKIWRRIRNAFRKR